MLFVWQPCYRFSGCRSRKPHGLAPIAPLFETDCTFTTLFYPDAENGSLLPSLRAGAFRIGLEDATATRAVRDRARQKDRFEEINSAILEAYQALTMDSDDDAFGAYRETLNRLWNRLE